MNEKIVLITGATSGIGKATLVGLAKIGFLNFILPIRNVKKIENMKKELMKINPEINADFYECDLASMASIKKFAKEVKNKYAKLDILINNAGVWQTNREYTVDGIETTFAVNVIAPFLLTTLFLDLLKKAVPSRVINVSSTLYARGRIDLNNLEGKNIGFSGPGFYSNSKMALVLLTKEWAKTYKESGITFNSLHPGVIGTNLIRNYGPVMSLIYKVVGRSPEHGAKTTIYLASSEEVSNISGEYFSNSKMSKTNEYSHDMELAKKLWDKCSEYNIDRYPVR